ncbi:2-methylcitrate dehydratase PrpD [Aspergillus campestris IBT 28561]|uniref:2-methylcitrate dehydratase PrpD n=1 Tax=Aspergillus campestris (strain IBT 28561) TaxID=1392248 RepID=A0A2I1DFN9_ASPC2|nr:2-methylcitrate dehydratase PrpD [Aspergillus campestris IBT 28561]PKY08692.1 2-methylcitrate dehydratase PrpD [Aspergillus campestris IBT 28561]
MTPTRTENLARWCTTLTYDDLPEAAIQRTKSLFVDWIGCAIAGRHHPAIAAIAAFSKQMGPASGKSEIVDASGGTSSAAFAALVNGAASHVVEQDDLHNCSIVHPATVVFPTALAVAQEKGATGKEFITACVVGYEVACRTGEYLGKTHYQNFHSTATAGTLGAAAAAAKLLNLDTDKTLSALGTAGTQAAGLWQFLLDATHSKQVHTGKACFDGIFAAYTAQADLLGPRDVLEGKRGMGASLVPSGATIPTAIDALLGQKYSVLESSFKWHASCRHTHPSVDALLKIVETHDVKIGDIESVVARMYQAGINVLSMSEQAETVHQSKFSMGFVLGVAAKYRRASINDFTEEALRDGVIREFQTRVQMVLDERIDGRFPEEWTGCVTVTTKGGDSYTEEVDVVKGDPGDTLSWSELESKVATLAHYAGLTDLAPVKAIMKRVAGLESESNVLGFQF